MLSVSDAWPRNPTRHACRTLFLLWLCYFSPVEASAQVQLQRLDILAGGQFFGAVLALPLDLPARALLTKRWKLRSILFDLPGATVRLDLRGVLTLEATRLGPSFRLRYDANRRITAIGKLPLRYDDTGRLTQLGSIRLRYDKLGQLENVQGLTIRRNINLQLAAFGQLKIQYNNNIPTRIGKRTLQTDSKGRLQKLGALQIAYDPLNGQVLSVKGNDPRLRVVVHWDLKQSCQRLRYRP